MTQTALFVALTDQGLIRASGEDAASFLHNLLTNDIKHLEPGQARHAGLCTAKGRLIASFLIWREGEDFLLQLSADILPGVLKKLSMYVLRSKVKLTDIRADRVLIGAIGAALPPKSPMSVQAREGGSAVRLDAERVVLALPRDAADKFPCDGELADWHRAEIRHGIPRILAATQETFTPQMLNYELAAVGGVSFQKGCYPGQEVVARTHYLGKVKRRMYRVKLDTEFAPGTNVFTPEAGDQHCGAVVLTAPAANGGYEALVVVQSGGAEADAIHVGAPTGPQGKLLPLPYAIE